MGEISDALKRANADDARRRQEGPIEERDRGDRDAPSPAPEPAPARRGSGDSFPLPLRDVQEAAQEEVKPDTDPAPLIEARDSSTALPARAVMDDPRSPTAELFRIFAIRVLRELDERSVRSLLVVGPHRFAGKTTTSCNLALAVSCMAEPRRTALVDLDLRRPSVASVLGIEPAAGIEEVLAGRAGLDEARVATDLEALDVYPVRRALSQPHEALTGNGLPQCIAQLEERYDLVVIDSPPFLVVPDADMILSHVGACMAVLRSRHTRVAAFRQMVDDLPREKLIGSFLNDVRLSRRFKQYGYYYKGYEADDE